MASTRWVNPQNRINPAASQKTGRKGTFFRETIFTRRRGIAKYAPQIATSEPIYNHP